MVMMVKMMDETLKSLDKGDKTYEHYTNAHADDDGHYNDYDDSVVMVMMKY